MDISSIINNLSKKYKFLDVDINEIFIKLFNNNIPNDLSEIEKIIEEQINLIILDNLNKDYSIIDK